MPEKVAAWKEQREAPTSVLGIRILLLVYRLLGRRVARWLAAAVLLVCYPFLKAPRRASADFRSRWEAHTGRRFPGGGLRHMRYFCNTMLDRLACWGGMFRQHHINVCTPGAVERATRDFCEGRGSFMVVSHLGNAELLRAVFLQLALEKGRRIHVYLDMELTQRFNAVLKKLGKEEGICFHSTHELASVGASIQLAGAVEQGDIVIMAGDRAPRSASRACATHPFLGRPARFPLGTFRMAAALQCPVYGVFLPSIGRRYELHAVQMSDGDVPAAELCRRFVKQLEEFSGLYPLNWFNFYPFWS